MRKIITQELKNKLNVIENERIQLFVTLNELNYDKLNYKQKTNSWSIIQIIHHLYKSEQLSIVYIKRAITKTEKVKKSGLLSDFRGFILSTALKSNLKFNAPQNVSDVPEFGKLEQYEKKWSRIRNELENIIKQSPEEILDSDIFSHPSVGKMNMMSALKFIEAHFNHHKKQIENLL